MGFGEAIGTCFRKYGDFQGRASRPEFWWFFLFHLLTNAALVLITYASWRLGLALLAIWWLGTFVPHLAVMVRRLHDAGYSGASWFISLIPFVGVIIFIVFLAQDGTAGLNAYGPPPGATGRYSMPGAPVASPRPGYPSPAPGVPAFPAAVRPGAVPASARQGVAMVRCPYCGEQVRAVAQVCRWCGRDLPGWESKADDRVVRAEPDGGIRLRLAGLSPDGAIERLAPTVSGHPEARLCLDFSGGGTGGGEAVTQLLAQIADLGSPGLCRDVTLVNPNESVQAAACALATARHWDWSLADDGMELRIRNPG
jgi:uncharacterized membrane protein YhaH (DUF805 family)